MMLNKKLKELSIGSVIIIFDRDFGRLIFRDIKGYGNLLDDTEWLLERTPQRSWGFMIRPIIQDGLYGLWIGEYTPNSNQVIREETLFGKGSSIISKLLVRYIENKVSEREINRRISIDALKKMIPESNIIRDFKYYICPEERFYGKCPLIEKIYKAIGEKYDSFTRLYCSQITEIISSVNKCHDVLICPILASPNALERIIILNKVLKNRRIGEIKINSKGSVQDTLVGSFK
ncbi:MAG: hypothetical protein QXF59_00235 [Candidatus Bathyarchaeia archaeon]